MFSKIFWLATLLLLWLPGWAQINYRLKIEPLDYQNERLGYSEYYFRSYKKIARLGAKLILIGNEPYILELDPVTKACQKIGKPGEGPGEFPGSLYAMTARDRDLWVVDGSRRQFVYHFVDGVYKDKLRIKSIGPDCASCATSIGVSDRELVIPVTPKSGYLAMAYGFDGSQKGIGELFFVNDVALLRKIPEMNHTMWTFGGGYWYAVFPCYPMALKFDRNFKLVNSFPLDHPLLQKRFADLLEWEPTTPDQSALSILTELNYFKGRLYLMAGSHLFQLDADSGEILSVARFFGEGDRFSKIAGPLYVPLFTFLEDGALLVANRGSDAWGHDLWLVKDPPFFDP